LVQHQLVADADRKVMPQVAKLHQIPWEVVLVEVVGFLDLLLEQELPDKVMPEEILVVALVLVAAVVQVLLVPVEQVGLLVLVELGLLG
jgi:membrane protein YdbS with pleckstrin-like domain